jgi:hypothetical protein
LTRNVGVTLTDLAYQVWVGIPHGLRSKLISGFLTKNAEALTNLESQYDKYLRLNKDKTGDSMLKLLLSIEPEKIYETKENTH